MFISKSATLVKGHRLFDNHCLLQELRCPKGANVRMEKYTSG